MAYKSLIDYYGGGMVKPSDGYQLGGLVAGARRQRDYSGEMRSLQQAAERAAESRKKVGGNLLRKLAVGTAGTLLGGPAGAAAALAGDQALRERAYKKTDFSGGKYAQDIRGELGKQESAFKKQGLARVGIAGVEGYMGGKSSGMFGKAAGGIKSLASDANMIKLAMQGPDGATFLEAAKGVGWDIPSVFGGTSTGIGKSLTAATAPKVASAAQAAPAVGRKVVTSLSDVAASEVPDSGGSQFVDRNVVTEEAVTPSSILQPAGYPYHDVGDIVEESTFIGPQMSSSSPAVAELPYETIEGSEYLPAGYGDQPQVAGGAGGGGYFDNLLGGRSFGDIMSQGASNMLQGLYTTGSLLGGMSNPYNKKGGGLIEGLMPRGYQDGGEVADTLAHIDWGDSSVVSMTPRQSEIFDLATNRIRFAPNTSKKVQLETLVDMMNNPKLYGWDKELKESKFIGPKQTSKKGIEPHYNFQDGGQVGYGTATNPQDALRQMGMGDVADDPRLEKYLEDLPQFGMGYKQQLGDITAGARSSLMDISQQGRMQQAGTGFAGGGAGTMGQSRARQQLQRGFGSQRRSLVEGYQADLLSAIADIEGKGGFEFGSTTGGADTRAGGVFDDAPISDENWNPPMNPTEGATYNFMGDEYIFTGGNWVTQESYQGQGE